ncbi:uncharacterized protein [Clytia hemisphaerica]|uniref:uncharacterized protein isoform X2 n=1 Tax=Clytia hemisphaerica TaxID=252671 RepID=UPI0034D5DE25
MRTLTIFLVLGLAASVVLGDSAYGRRGAKYDQRAHVSNKLTKSDDGNFGYGIENGNPVLDTPGDENPAPVENENLLHAGNGNEFPGGKRKSSSR